MKPPDDMTELSDLASVECVIDALTWEESERPDLMGVEVEAFPIMTKAGQPTTRLPLRGSGGARDLVAGVVGASPADQPAHGPIPVPGGGHITFEPGGQIEYSSAPHLDIPSLLSEVDMVWDGVQSEFLDQDVSLVCLGIDPWHDSEQVPQQLKAGRYVAMDAYFSSTWPAGAEMMRNTCSLQVNVQSGRRVVRAERWLAANLMSPILTAMFATSPGAGGTAVRRAKIWQAIDPSRTGLPAWDNPDDVEPWDDVRRRALRASVMFIVREGSTTPLQPGWSFEDWVRHGHPAFGRPTPADLRTHLSTLFPEVRPRGGTLELRGIDSVPRRWWPVPIVLTGAILSHDRARGHVIELLTPIATRLSRVWAKAADHGLEDPELAALAGKLGQLALDAAVDDGRFDHESIAITERFLDRFTMRGLAPGEELRSLLPDAGDALRWSLNEQVGEAVP